jgi:hypothetical protein
VLTAWHVVKAAGPGGPIDVRMLTRCGEPSAWYRAVVAWPSPEIAPCPVDAALLALDDDAWHHCDLAPVRWGRIVGDQPITVTGLGFPDAARGLSPGGTRRDTLPLRGQIDPLAHVKSGERRVLLGLEGALVPARGPGRTSPWAGTSGTVLFATGSDVVLAVVTADHDLAVDARSLTAVPVAALVGAEAFVAVAAAHGIEIALVEVGDIWDVRCMPAGTGADLFRGFAADDDAPLEQIMTIVKTALESVAGLGFAIVSTADASRRRALDKLFADLEAVHSDYLVMFEAILDRVPDAWEEAMPHFSEKVRATASELRRLRLTYEPVRVRVQAVAETFADTRLPAAERAFVEAVLAYFPTGELRGEDLTQQVRTSGTVVLDHLYQSLDGELGLDLGSLVRDTLRFHRQRWSAVCLAHAALRLSGGSE